MMTEFDFRQRFERIALETMKERKGVALPTNVDYYSGFAYEMFRYPERSFTHHYLCAAVWSAGLPITLKTSFMMEGSCVLQPSM